MSLPRAGRGHRGTEKVRICLAATENAYARFLESGLVEDVYAVDPRLRKVGLPHP